MKRYTESIPYELYLKFSDAIGQFEKTPTYAEVFDWLTEKGVYVGITRSFAQWGWLLFVEHAIAQQHFPTWYDAANAAIDSALKLLANA